MQLLLQEITYGIDSVRCPHGVDLHLCVSYQMFTLGTKGIYSVDQSDALGIRSRDWMDWIGRIRSESRIWTVIMIL